MSDTRAQNQQPAPLPPVSSGSANSHLRRTARMNAIPAAGSAQPPSLTTNSVSNTSGQQNPKHVDAVPLHKVYLESRREIEELKEENLNLRNSIATMVIRDSGAKGRKRGPQKIDDDEDTDITLDSNLFAKIVKLGRWCVLFRACYFDIGHFVGLDEESTFGVDDPVRFLDDEHKDMGITEDLRDAIPQKYHRLFSVSADASKKGDSISKFRDGASTGRSNFVKLLKEQVGGIFDVPEMTTALSPEGRLDIPRVQFLIGSEKDPVTSCITYPPCFPALCRNEDATNDDNLFRSEVLFRIARGIVFGSTSIFNKENAVSRSISQFLRVDRPPGTTPAFIALCSIVARFLLSTDKQFDSGGKGRSGIAYKDNYFYYLQFIIDAIKHNPRWYSKVMGEWDANVFSKQVETKEAAVSANGGTSSGGTEIIDRTNEIAQRLEEMRLRSVGDGDQEPDTQMQPGQFDDSDNIPSPDPGEDDSDMYAEETPVSNFERLDDVPRAPVDQTADIMSTTQSIPERVDHPSISPDQSPALESKPTAPTVTKAKKSGKPKVPLETDTQERRSLRPRGIAAGAGTATIYSQSLVEPNAASPILNDAPPAAPKKSRAKAGRGRGVRAG
ncbi:hypothetical protein GALMADRAFT_216478 [Galerina marginata CBS 339.88]|uniref:Uncharacterized protein n=1 Tax=Galerina marginata (strain CBS 339.88) TaxID=685588 RepID=A0A067S941_GALM3|nr:hypothetical protein GALMADRAFT_216478 [Galerina marginata CBS 339.88]